MSSRRGPITISYQCGCLSSYLLGMGFNVHFSRHGGNKKLFISTKIELYVISGELLELITLHGWVCSLLNTSCHCADKHNFKSIQTVLCNTLLLLRNKIEKHSTVASAVVGNVFKPAFTLTYLI